ncbi:MAG: hypothetical protein K9L62_02110 [Vallitaleaceae bacterium]|nr:hypothetical protein [Vallitaleaceae bacterium]
MKINKKANCEECCNIDICKYWGSIDKVCDGVRAAAYTKLPITVTIECDRFNTINKSDFEKVCVKKKEPFVILNVVVMSDGT